MYRRRRGQAQQVEEAVGDPVDPQQTHAVGHAAQVRGRPGEIGLEERRR